MHALGQTLRDRVDHQANEMARPADPSSVLGMIKNLNAGGFRGVPGDQGSIYQLSGEHLTGDE